MILFLIYIFVISLLLKKIYDIIFKYEKYYSDNNFSLNLVKATTIEKQQKGLMYRKQPLKNNEGLLFIYKNPQKIKMWMKNTYIPLDLLFLDDKMKVVDYKENLKPHDIKTNYSSNIKSRLAIEINGGSIKKNNIKKGTIIVPKYINKLS